MSKVYDIGDDGGKWFVSGSLLANDARLAIIKHLEEQLSPTALEWGGAEPFAWEVHEALHAKATKYFFVAVDRDTELVYSDAPFGPRREREHNADFLGNPGYAIGFTMPAWKEKS